MRLKALFLRSLFALAGFSLPLAVLAAAAPWLINAEPVKERLVKELSAWTGSDVQINGAVAIESFGSLSLNARNVDFFGFEGFPGFKTLKADEIVARIAWAGLFSGRLDFDKIKMSGARVELDGAGQEDALKAAEALLAMSPDAQFSSFNLRDCRISVASGPHGYPQEYSIENLNVSLEAPSREMSLSGRIASGDDSISISLETRAGVEGGQDLPLNAVIESRSLAATFNGVVRLGRDWRATGAFAFDTPDAQALGGWFGENRYEGLDLPLSLSGRGDFSQSNWRLSGGRFAIAGQAGSGDFDLAFKENGTDLQASAAFRTLDLDSLLGAGKSEARAKAVREALIASELDMLLSADRIIWRGIEARNAAFTLIGRKGRISAEIAHAAMFGGSILGQSEIDITGPEARLRARITGEALDSAMIQSLAVDQGWLSGRAGVSAEINASGGSLGEMLDEASVAGTAAFSDGGRVRLDLNRIMQIKPGDSLEGWNDIDNVWSDFEELRFAFALDKQSFLLRKIAMTRADNIVNGEGAVIFPGRRLDWRIRLSPRNAAADGSPGEAQGFSILGSWSRPRINSVQHENRALRGQPVGRRALLEATDDTLRD